MAKRHYDYIINKPQETVYTYAVSNGANNPSDIGDPVSLVNSQSGGPDTNNWPSRVNYGNPIFTPSATDTFQGSAGAIVVTVTPSTARIVPETSTATSKPAITQDASEQLNDGPSGVQIAVAVIVPAVLVLFALVALLLIHRRRKQRRQFLTGGDYPKQMGAYGSQSPRPLIQPPQIPMPAAQPALSLSISTRLNNVPNGQPQRFNLTYYTRNPSRMSTRHSRQALNQVSRKQVHDDDEPPPPYMPRICTTPEGIPITHAAPARLTEENLARQDPSSRRSAPHDDDDIVSEISDRDRNAVRRDDVSVVSDISYRGQAPHTVHQTV